MGLTFNGNTPDAITYNGNTVSRVLYNNVEVWSAQPVPSPYTYLEYLESSGTQYINVSSILNPHPTDFKIVADFKFNSTSGTVKFTGIAWSSYWIQLGCNNGDFLMQSGGSGTEKTFGTADTNRHTWTVDHLNHIFTLDSTSQSYTGSFPDVSRDLYIFARDNYGSASQYASGRLYSYKIYFNDVLSYDFEPARRVSDSELGLYDAANDVFYTNQGTGSFVAGPVIN